MAKIKVTKNNSGEVEIEGELAAETVRGYAAAALAEIQKDFELAGFRRGHVPVETVEAHVDPMRLWEDGADAALNDALRDLAAEHKLHILSRPLANILKLAPGNPVEFKIRAAILPEIKLPGYRKIARSVFGEAPVAAASDEDVEKTLEELGGAYAPPSEDGEAALKLEFTDESVKKLGDFKNLADFKTKIKANLQAEKEAAAREGNRERLADKLLAASAIPVSEILVNEELAHLENRRGEELARLGTSLEDYLRQTGKTLEEVRREERAYVERQFKTKFILQAIAEAEKIEATAQEIEFEATLLARRNPEANPEHLRTYVAEFIRHEKVWRLLEAAEKSSEPQAGA